MQEITNLDAAQRIDDRGVYAPLRRDDEWPARRAEGYFVWPLHRSCNGNCNQGRMCDCVPAVAEDEPASMGEGAGVFIWPLVTVAVMFAALLIVHFWRA